MPTKKTPDCTYRWMRLAIDAGSGKQTDLPMCRAGNTFCTLAVKSLTTCPDFVVRPQEPEEPQNCQYYAQPMASNAAVGSPHGPAVTRSPAGCTKLHKACIFGESNPGDDTCPDFEQRRP